MALISDNRSSSFDVEVDSNVTDRFDQVEATRILFVLVTDPPIMKASAFFTKAKNPSSGSRIVMISILMKPLFKRCIIFNCSEDVGNSDLLDKNMMWFLDFALSP